MVPTKVLQFKAFGVEPNGEKYECSFYVSYAVGKVSQGQVQQMVNEQVAQFRAYHPTGNIVGQNQATVMMG